MLCDRCGQRPASVHLTEIANGNKKESHLCEVCAGEIKPVSFGFAPQMGLHKFLAGLLSHQQGGGAPAPPEAEGLKCEKCGGSEGQFIKKGLLGCGDCYTGFEEKMMPLLRRIHGNSKHTGKVPGRNGGRVRLLKEIEGLKARLKEAVDREEYEQAAIIRDNIRQLERNLEEGGRG